MGLLSASASDEEWGWRRKGIPVEAESDSSERELGTRDVGKQGSKEAGADWVGT